MAYWRCRDASDGASRPTVLYASPSNGGAAQVPVPFQKASEIQK
jgi:hypothetical protein